MVTQEVIRSFCIYCKSKLTNSIEQSNYYHEECRNEILEYNKPPPEPFIRIIIKNRAVRGLSDDIEIFRFFIPEEMGLNEITFNFNHMMGIIVNYNQRIVVDSDIKYQMTIISRRKKERKKDRDYEIGGLTITRYRDDWRSDTFSHEYIHIYKNPMIITAIKLKAF